MALAGGGSTSNGRPYTLIVPNGGSGESGVETLPLHTEFSGVTFTVAAGAIRLAVSALTTQQLTKLNSAPKLWLLADDGTEGSEVRQIQYAELVDGTPDTYFVVVDEPFTVAAATYDFKYVDPSDAQRNNTVIAVGSNVYVDGVDTIPAGASQTFEPDMPFKPIVLYSDTDFKVSNGFFFELSATVAEALLEEQEAGITATTLFTPSEDGWYLVGWNADVSRAATVSSLLGHFQTRYTCPADSNVKNTPTQNNVTASSGNTTSTAISGTFSIYAKGGTPIQYIMGYTSSGATTMQYSLHIIVKKL